MLLSRAGVNIHPEWFYQMWTALRVFVQSLHEYVPTCIDLDCRL